VVAAAGIDLRPSLERQHLGQAIVARPQVGGTARVGIGVVEQVETVLRDGLQAEDRREPGPFGMFLEQAAALPGYLDGSDRVIGEKFEVHGRLTRDQGIADRRALVADTLASGVHEFARLGEAAEHGQGGGTGHLVRGVPRVGDVLLVEPGEEVQDRGWPEEPDRAEFPDEFDGEVRLAGPLRMLKRQLT
jgi:hypothetical protein